MPIYYRARVQRRHTRAAVAVSVASLVLLGGAVIAAADDHDLPLIVNPFYPEPSRQAMTSSGPPAEVHERSIDVVGDLPGMQSYLLHAPIRQPAWTYGPARDTIRARFSQPVDVHGLSASVDLSAALFELEAGINKENYGGNSNGWLFHYTSENNQKIDESVMFPRPFRLSPTDYLSLTAWISNTSSAEAIAQPEVIVYFTPA
jgi:hypothetical protein